MIDGISLLILDADDIDNIRQNKALNFDTFRSYQVAKYKGLRIKISSRYCRIDGSLHKYKNDGEHNTDDFDYYDLEKVLSDLYNEVGINPETAIIQNIEVGVNLRLGYNPLQFTESIIKRKTHYPEQNSIGAIFRHSQYSIKIYSKSKQEKKYAKDNILRLEIRFEKMIEARKKLGKIETLDDLLNPLFWIYSGRCISEVLNDIDIIDIDSAIKGNIPDKEKIELLSWRHSNRYEECSTKRMRMKEKMYKIAETYSLTEIKTDIQRMVKDKVTQLSDHPNIRSSIDYMNQTRDKMLQII